MIRKRIGRIATASTVVAMLASAVLAGGAAAANNRLVYFGTPTNLGGTGGSVGDTGLTYGTLAGETKVTAGGRTMVTVLLRNDDNQTLNHVKFAGGTTADAKPDNPTFLTPPGTSLPTGATIAAVFPSLGTTTCTTTPAAGFECLVGQLGANASVTFQVVINAPATKGDYAYWLTGSWNEGWSSTGANADYNFATGTLKVLEANCGNGQANWFLSNEFVNLDENSATPCNGDQEGSIKSIAKLTGNGGFASFAVDGTQAVACPTGFKCFGETVSASVLSGDAVPGGLQWTIRWYGTKTMKGVIHYADNYATSGVFTAITFSRQGKCSATLVTNCWTTLVTNNKPAWIEATFITNTNGKGGGFN